MSIKIYSAYRLRSGVDLFEFISDTRKKAEHQIQSVLTKNYDNIVLEAAKDHDFRKMLLLTVKEPLVTVDVTNRMASLYIQKSYHEQLSSPYKHHYHMDVGITIRKKGRRYYLIPFANGIMANVLSFLNDDKRLEDFCYENQTDYLPEGVSAAQYKKREKVWESFWTPNSKWRDVLVLNIFTYDLFSAIDPIWKDMEF